MNEVFDIVYPVRQGVGTFLSYKKEIQDDWLPALWGYARPQNLPNNAPSPSDTNSSVSDLTQKPG